MKKLATMAAAVAAAASASAQSSVTLFGVIDVGARYTDNAGETAKSLSSSGLSSNRWGVRGVEDLGDGFKANFWIEAGIRPDTGSSADTTRIFDRRSTVGLSWGFGELRVGRDRVSTYTTIQDFDAFTDNGVAGIGHFFDKLGTTSTRRSGPTAYSETQVTPLSGFGGADKYKVLVVGGKWDAGFARPSSTTPE